MLIDGVTSGYNQPSTVDRVFETSGICESCGKPLGRLRATSIVPLGMGMKRYPVNDPVLYHISPIMTQARIGCK